MAFSVQRLILMAQAPAIRAVTPGASDWAIAHGLVDVEAQIARGVPLTATQRAAMVNAIRTTRAAGVLNVTGMLPDAYFAGLSDGDLWGVFVEHIQHVENPPDDTFAQLAFVAASIITGGAILGAASGEAAGAASGEAAGAASAVDDAAIVGASYGGAGDFASAVPAAVEAGAPSLFPLELAAPEIAVPSLGATDTAAIAEAAGATSSVTALVKAADFVGTLKAAGVSLLKKMLGESDNAATAAAAAPGASSRAAPAEPGLESALPALVTVGLFVALAIAR